MSDHLLKVVPILGVWYGLLAFAYLSRTVFTLEQIIRTRWSSVVSAALERYAGPSGMDYLL